MKPKFAIHSLLAVLVLLALAMIPAAAAATGESCYFYNNADDAEKVYLVNDGGAVIARVVRSSWLGVDTWSQSRNPVSVTGDISALPGGKPGNGNKYARYWAQQLTTVNGQEVYVDVCYYAGQNP